MGSRVSYLDVVESCPSASCVKMSKRFINQNGAPKEILPDNGSDFTSKQVKEFITLHGIKWNYDTAEAPWAGKFFEHMVRSVKQCLQKILGQARVRFKKLLTKFKELENIFNSRSLSYIYDDDILEPLSPYRLVHRRAIGRKCVDTVNRKETDVSVESLN